MGKLRAIHPGRQATRKFSSLNAMTNCQVGNPTLAAIAPLANYRNSGLPNDILWRY